MSNPEVTKPTTRTVVTEEDCSTAVTTAPAPAAVKRLVVTRPRKVFMPVPATVFRASVILRIP